MSVGRFSLLISMVLVGVFVTGIGAAAADVPTPLALAERMYVKWTDDNSPASFIESEAYIFENSEAAKKYYDDYVFRMPNTSGIRVTRESIDQINQASSGFLINDPKSNNNGAAVVVLDHYYVFALYLLESSGSFASPSPGSLADMTKLAQTAFGKPRQPAKNTGGPDISDLMPGPSLAPLDLTLRFDEVPPGYQFYSEEVRVPVPDAIASDK